ncbi:MAG: ribokinase [Acidobacteriota bacterium]|nr:ribokinase [Acidobacteriota bacterium]
MKNIRRPRIVVAGSANTDMIVHVPHIPKPGETVLGSEFRTAAGGKGANQAVAAARAAGGGCEVVFIGRVGDDAFGKNALKGLARENIRTDFLTTDENSPSGVALIAVDGKGENAIAVASGANAAISASDMERASDIIAESSLLLVQLEIPLPAVVRAAEIAAANGVPVMLNPAPVPPAGIGDDLLRNIAWLTPNETEAETLSGIRFGAQSESDAAADALLDRGVDAVLITLGAGGVFAASGKERFHFPAFPVQAVDTTAAGDVFNGALAVALVEGKTLHEAVRFASAAAALSVTRPGAQPSIPGRAEINDFLAGHR